MNPEIKIAGPCRLKLMPDGQYQISGGVTLPATKSVPSGKSVTFKVDLPAIQKFYTLAGAFARYENEVRTVGLSSCPAVPQGLAIDYGANGDITIICGEEKTILNAKPFGVAIDLMVESTTDIVVSLIIVILECTKPPCPAGFVGARHAISFKLAPTAS